MGPGDAQSIVFRAIDRVNEVQPEDNLLAKSPATILIGQGGQLDSMGFVNFVAALEEEMHDALDDAVNVSDELNSKSQDAKAATVGDWIEVVHSLIASSAGARGAQINR